MIQAAEEDVAVQKINRAIQIEHGSVEVSDSDFLGLPIKHARVITSKRSAAAAAR